MTNQVEACCEEKKRGEAVNEDYRLYLIIAFLIFFLSWMLTPFVVGYFMIPFGFYYLWRARRAKNGVDTFICSVCSGKVGKEKLSKCPRCGVDLD